MKVSLIYMASGFGKRYGTNKLITEFQGEPLYLHGLLSLQKAAKLLEEDKIQCKLFLISSMKEFYQVLLIVFLRQNVFLMKTVIRGSLHL